MFFRDQFRNWTVYVERIRQVNHFGFSSQNIPVQTTKIETDDIILAIINNIITDIFMISDTYIICQAKVMYMPIFFVNILRFINFVAVVVVVVMA